MPRSKPEEIRVSARRAISVFAGISHHVHVRHVRSMHSTRLDTNDTYMHGTSLLSGGLEGQTTLIKNSHTGRTGAIYRSSTCESRSTTGERRVTDLQSSRDPML